MRTLILAERPFRDLRSRAWLLDLPRRYADAGPLLVAMPHAGAPTGFTAVDQDPDPAALGVQRVVIAGAFQEAAQIERAFATASRAVQAGARLETAAFSVARACALRDPPVGAEVLDAATSLEMRDWFSADRMMLWRIAVTPHLRPYPEAALAADDSLAALLPPGPLLGLAVMDGAAMRRDWMAMLPALAERLAPFAGIPVLPLPSEHMELPSDDYAGSLAFAAAALPGTPILLPQLADRVWRRRELSPARLKGLVARCALVVTNQDIPAAFATAAGLPVLGLALGGDRRIVVCLSQLANRLAPGSALLYPPRAGSALASSSARA